MRSRQRKPRRFGIVRRAATAVVAATALLTLVAASPASAGSGPEESIYFSTQDQTCFGFLDTGVDRHGRHLSTMRVVGWCRHAQIYVMYRDGNGNLQTTYAGPGGAQRPGGNIELDVLIDADVVRVWGHLISVHGQHAWDWTP